MTCLEANPLNQITEKIIGAFFAVHSRLGPGFLEKVYENALAIELSKAGLKSEQQKPVKVFYREQIVGEFFADVLVEEKILVELKAVKNLADAHFAQCLNYLKATKLPVGFLVNFGEASVKFKRLINPELRITIK